MKMLREALRLQFSAEMFHYLASFPRLQPGRRHEATSPELRAQRFGHSEENPPRLAPPHRLHYCLLTKHRLEALHSFLLYLHQFYGTKLQVSKHGEANLAPVCP